MNKIFNVLVPLLFCLSSNSQSVDFTYQSTNGLYCSPSVIEFTQTSTGNPVGFEWDFGNGRKAYSPNETLTFNSAGTYTVKLTALFTDRILKVSKTIVINPPIKASITVDKNYICSPGVINFTGSGNGNIANYQWNFGDGTALVNTTAANTSHSFTKFETDTVTLRATDVAGCYGDTSIVVLIRGPQITTTGTPSRGCIPADVAFTANVVLPSNSLVTSYAWDFGDGSPQSVTTDNTSNHVYSPEGVYAPKVTVTTNDGCTRIHNIDTLKFGSPPTNTLAYPIKPIICGSEPALLVARGTNANRYYWTFGDGTFLNTTDSIGSHKYTTLGVKSMGVTVSYNGCIAPYARTTVTVIGVIAHFSIANTCANKNVISFANTSQGNVSSSLWNFGDGIQQANISHPVHPYPPTGQFLSSLIVNDVITGCADTSTRVINTAIPVFTSSLPAVCRNDSVTFSIANNYVDTTATYTWNVLGAQIGPDSTGKITVKANIAGRYNNFVVIDRGPEFCLDTVRSASEFVVGGPELNFNVQPDICFINPVVITNNSRPFIPADTVTLWYWNYGQSAQNDSVFQPSPFQYTIPGAYTVTLTAVDKNGCMDTLTKTINVNPVPFLSILPKSDTICAGQPVTLVALNNDDKVIWSPSASLSCLDCDTTIATPMLSSKFYATVSNVFNCSIIDSNYVEVSIPFSSTSGNASICSDETVVLDAMPKGKKILWSPATGLSDPAVYNPIARPLQSTSYVATLTDSLGCFSSNTTFSVNVKPLPVVDAGPDISYPKGTSFSFTPTYSSNVSSYTWSPPDLLSCGDCAVPSAVANFNQIYILMVTSDSGCVAGDSVTINTECKSSDLFMPKAFTPDNNGLNDFYFPMARGFKSISAFTIFNRQGKIIYSARNFPPNDRSFGWNGKYKGKNQSTDTYVYTLEAICDIGEKFNIKGSFVLVR